MEGKKAASIDVGGRSYAQTMIKKSRLALVPAIAAALMFTGCSAPTVAEKPSQEEPAPAAEEPVEEPEVADEGTRSNPYPLGTKATSGDWSVTVNSVNLDGTAAVMDANPVNESPAEGNTYIVVEATTEYVGADDSGQVPFAYIDYVSVDGNTISASFVVPPGEDFITMNELYVGGSHSGSVVFEVPSASAGDGVLAVSPDMVGDKVFVAVK